MDWRTPRFPPRPPLPLNRALLDEARTPRHAPPNPRANAILLAQALAKLGTPILDGLMAPGRALSGEYDTYVNPMTGENTYGRGGDPLAMERDATGLAGMVTLGSAPIPRPPNSLGMGSLRERYAGPLIEATGAKVDVRRMKLTPQRIEAAKAAMKATSDLKAQLPKGYLSTDHAKQAYEFAVSAIRSGKTVSLKYPEGQNGSVYVRVGDKGTIRFSNHAAPSDHTGTVGGYSSAMGRRHQPAVMSVDARGGKTLTDAMRWLASMGGDT